MKARTVTAWALTAALVLGGALLLRAAAFPLPRAPQGLHRWLPLPVACAGGQCITYRAWTVLIDHTSSEDGPALLTEALTSRAARMVARRTGVPIADAEVDAALTVVETLAAETPGLRKFLEAQYGDRRQPAFRKGIEDILVRAKLAAAGIPDVWAHPTAPWVVILHFRYRWDAHSHRVVSR